MNKFLLPSLLAGLSLSACAGQQNHLQEPVVQIQRVEVPVVVPCPALGSVGHPPALPDTSAALRSAPNIAERVKLLMAGRALRDGWIGNADQAITACSRP